MAGPSAHREGPLAARVLKYIRKHRLIAPGDRVAVAVSGGPDSVALLRLLLELRSELGVVLSVAHFNHQLRGTESDADAVFVSDLAKSFDLELHSASGDAAAHAKKSAATLESAARELRYQFFHSLLDQGAATSIATGHTLDDQAETVLMKLLRGAGTKGLAGIHPVLKARHGTIIRPLLAIRRSEVEAYLRSLGQPWHEDSSNLQLHHTRNRVRHQLIPLLEKFNPSLAATLAETAELSRAEEEYWAAITSDLLPAVFNAHSCSLQVAALLEKPLAVQRRLLRAAAAHTGITLEFEHVEELRELMHSPPSQQSRTLDLPGGRACLQKNPGGRLLLEFRQPWQEPYEEPAAGGFEYRLAWPCELSVPETGSTFRLRLVPPGKPTPPESALLDPNLLAAELCLRDWRPGDRFHSAHTGAPKKIKELLQRIPRSERRLWPVIASGDHIIWLRDFPPPERLTLSHEQRRTKAGLLIEEVISPAS